MVKNSGTLFMAHSVNCDEHVTYWHRIQLSHAIEHSIICLGLSAVAACVNLLALLTFLHRFDAVDLLS